MGVGDDIMAAGHAQVAHDRDPDRRVAICDDQWRPRWHAIWEGNPVIASPKEVLTGTPAQFIRNAANCRPYIQYPFTRETGWRVTPGWRARDQVGRIYLTDAERRFADAVRHEGPFVVIEPWVAPKATPNKLWPFARYARVVAECAEVLRFVQPIYERRRPLPGAIAIEATFREACALLDASEGYVGPEGGLHHAAAALGKPATVIFGGFMDPDVTGYPSHTNLTGRALPPGARGRPRPPVPVCGSYLPCAHCRGCLDRITVDQVVDAVRGMVGVPA